MSQERKSILVIDDDPDACLVMRAALRKAGYDVRVAHGGEEGLRQFRSSPADMVMLDVDMPDLDGYQVCGLLRAEADPLLPIVMVTGMDDVPSVEAAYDHGATDFIAKPVNWALVGHRVRYLFRGQQALLDLRAAQARNDAILSAIPDLLFEVDIEGRYLDFRAPREDLLSASPRNLLGKTVSDVLTPEAASVCLQALQVADELGSSMGHQFELPLDKGPTWFELSISRKTPLAGEKPTFIVLSRNITERKDAETRITRMAYVDGLTGLPNRRSFLERVDLEIRRARMVGSKLAVMFMDLDGFKAVNDTMGHGAGDWILQAAAERLRDGLRPSDVLSRPMGLDGANSGEVELARLGGDEFTALLLGVEHPPDVLRVAQRIGESIRKPFVVDGQEVHLSTSIGIAIFPDHGVDGATLVGHADTAMYSAKRSGRDNAQLFCPSSTDCDEAWRDPDQVLSRSVPAEDL